MGTSVERERERERDGDFTYTKAKSLLHTHHDSVLAVVLYDSYLLRKHSQLLKIDKSIDSSLVAVIEKSKVFL